MRCELTARGRTRSGTSARLTAAVVWAMTVTVLLHAQTAAPETPRFTCTSTRFSNFSTRSGRYSTRLRVRRLQIGMPLAHPYEEVA
jgi:hypothetical protein